MMATRWSAASRRSAFQKAFSCGVVGGDGVAVGVPLHAGVAVGAEAAEEAVVGDAELLHGVVELAAPVLAQPVLAVGGEVLELGHQDLAHLTGGARDQGDAAAHGDVLRHRRAVLDRLVVGVGVDEQQALVGYGESRCRAIGRAANSGRNGRSGSSQSTSPSSSAASQRTASCSTGSGSPATRAATATRSTYRSPIGVSSASQAVTAMSQPSSSRTSRTSAASGASPGSTLPPGSSHRPATSRGAVRRHARTRPSRTIAAPTTT